MSAPSRALWALVLLAVLVAPASSLASGQPDSSGLTARTPVSVVGTENLTASDGAVHFRDPDVPRAFELEAGRVTLDLTWESGYKTGPPGQRPFVDVAGDAGRSQESFSNASVTISPFQGNPEILAYPEGGAPTIQVTGTGDHPFSRLETPYMTMVGKSSSTQEAGDAETVGFWYEPRDPWLIGRGSDHATVTGNFSVFINNATVSVTQQQDTVWQNWTGYEEEGQGPGTQTYERHVLRIRVVDGRLSLAAEDRIQVAGSPLQVNTTGTVSAPSASGRLSLEGRTVAFQQDPLEMRGTGGLTLTEPPERSEPGDWLSLGVDSGSSFEVEGGNA